jgi:prepilin-type N-terminal cleavage/methylation domain-containing protein
MRTIRRSRTDRRGFSLLEAMIAAVVLGVGLVGLTRLHIASIQGTVRSEDLSRAAEVAREIADTFTLLDWPNLPVCAPGPTAPPTWVNPPSPQGCSSSLGTTNVLNPDRGPGCTAWYTADGVPDVSQPGWTVDPMAGDGSVPDTGNFRVDLAVSRHPDFANFPDINTVQPGQEPVQVLWIWVCWRDDVGNVHEVSAARVMTRDL